MIAHEKPTGSQVEHLAQSLCEVLESLSGNELVDATVQAVLKHRCLIERVEAAYNALNEVADDDPCREELLKAYSGAMLNNRAQIAVVAALTDKLGYVPEIPQEAQPRS